MPQPNIIVLHVACGYEARARHIESMMQRHGLEFEYMLRGDIPQVTPQVLDEYFCDSFGGANAYTSCSYKHLLACERIVAQNWSGAVIMEDEAVLFTRLGTMLQIGRAHV